MINNIKIALLSLFFCATSSFGQAVDMADNFRSDGKIYVVLAVLAVILTAIFILLFRLEAKLKELVKNEKVDF